MRPTRREFFGVAAVALGGAHLIRQDSRIPARFVGDAFERGHHWLTPDPEKLHVDQKEKKRVVVVGGGIAGVVAAWRLLEAGVDDFVLLELEDKAGGLGRTGMIGSTVVPFGGTLLARPSEATSAPVKRILDATWAPRTSAALAPKTIMVRPWDHGWSHANPGFAESAPASFDEKNVAGMGLRVSMGPSQSEFGERWCLMRFGARSEDISAAALVKDVSRRVENGGLRALFVPAGFAALIEPLVEKIATRLLRARVAVLVKDGAAAALVRAVNALDARVTDYEADAVVLALPPFVARKIAPALRERDKDLVLPENTPWLVTAFQVSEWPKGFDASAQFHQTADERATMIVGAGAPPDGVIVVHRPFPASATLPARMFLRDLDADEARDWSFREMDPVLPDLRRVTKRVELWRIGHGSVRPAPGYLTKVAPRIRTPLGRIHPCGADYAGVPCIEAAVEDGVRGAEAVLAGLGKLDRSWL